MSGRNIRDVLKRFGFRPVTDTPAEFTAQDRDTGISLTLQAGGQPTVQVGGAFFEGCRTVGDLRKLINLLGHTVPGDKWYPGDTTADQIFWGRADGMPLELPETDINKGV